MTDYFALAKHILRVPSAHFPVICAWCKEPTGTYSPIEHTDGMCGACHERLMDQAKTARDDAAAQR